MGFKLKYLIHFELISFIQGGKYEPNFILLQANIQFASTICWTSHNRLIITDTYICFQNSSFMFIVCFSFFLRFAFLLFYYSRSFNKVKVYAFILKGKFLRNRNTIGLGN